MSNVRRVRELVVLSRPLPGAPSGPAASVEASDRLADVLKDFGAHITPCYRASRSTPRTAVDRAASKAAVPSILARLPDFAVVDAADEAKDELAARLREHPAVEAAFVKPAPEPPVRFAASPAPVQPPSTLASRRTQRYLAPAPAGIGARFAWTRPGGRGEGVNVVDVEGEWNFTHEDLVVNQGGMIGGSGANDLAWRNHGTAVVGEIGADVNSIGCTGIAPAAHVRGVSVFGITGGTAGAIRQAADALSPGDILLAEVHFPGPRFDYDERPDQKGYIAAEWWPDTLAAIVYATEVRGVIVVEAAGNGAEDLDDALYDTAPEGFPSAWLNPFRSANPQSGAILVGAGAPPPGTHGTTAWGPDRSRLEFSNYGARLDVQGWGSEVTTTGYGDLSGATENEWYTHTFSGTSSAAPIVVGALACIQGALRAAGRALLTPASALALLRANGSPQQAGLHGPSTQRIGNRPDLRAAFQSLGLARAGRVRPVQKRRTRRAAPRRRKARR